MPLLIDTHAHLNFNAYKDDAEEVIRRSLDSGIWMINVGSQSTTSERAVKMAKKYKEGVYAAIGIQPIHLVEAYMDDDEIQFKTKGERFEPELYQKLIDEHAERMGGLERSKIVAVGEMGLEYYRLDQACADNNLSAEDVKKIQREAVVEQMKFAKKNNLPLILHCRGSEQNKLDAYNDLLDILITNHQSLISNPGVVHCYVGDIETAQKFMELGFYIGFTGIVTFGKNADDVREVVKNIPLNRILVETDCPYLAPEPHRGERNEPAFVEFVARRIAEVKGVSFEEVCKKTTENARKLFKI